MGKENLLQKRPFYNDRSPKVTAPLPKKLQARGVVSFTQPPTVNAMSVGPTDTPTKEQHPRLDFQKTFKNSASTLTFGKTTTPRSRLRRARTTETDPEQDLPTTLRRDLFSQSVSRQYRSTADLSPVSWLKNLDDLTSNQSGRRPQLQPPLPRVRFTSLWQAQQVLTPLPRAQIHVHPKDISIKVWSN